MSRSTVTRLFVGGVVAMLAGAVIAVVALVAALVGGGVVIGGPALVEVHEGPLAWPLVGLVVASMAIIGGSIAGLVSWIGALLNSARLEDKTWFTLLLVLGLFSFGWVAMVAYILAGPDGSVDSATPSARRSRMATGQDS